MLEESETVTFVTSRVTCRVEYADNVRPTVKTFNDTLRIVSKCVWVWGGGRGEGGIHILYRYCLVHIFWT